MKNLRRSNREEEEEESVFVPMTDMTVSFLFIVMILLAFFAVRFSDTDNVPRATYENLKQQYDTLLTDHQQLKRELGELKRQLAQLLDRNKELEETIQKKEETVARLTARIEALLKRLNAQNPLELYITAAQAQRLEILREIEKALKIEFKDEIQVEISPENDALRFTGEGLFDTNKAVFKPGKTVLIERLADLLTKAISCYTINNITLDYKTCNPYGIVIEAVQVEGHTDSQGNERNNLMLSTARANNAFLTMLESQPDLLTYSNIRGQPVMSVAGYGQMRPIASNDTSAGRAENRRIDLRLIMYTPRDSDQVERIQHQIRDSLRLELETSQKGESTR